MSAVDLDAVLQQGRVLSRSITSKGRVSSRAAKNAVSYIYDSLLALNLLDGASELGSVDADRLSLKFGSQVIARRILDPTLAGFIQKKRHFNQTATVGSSVKDAVIGASMLSKRLRRAVGTIGSAPFFREDDEVKSGDEDCEAETKETEGGAEEEIDSDFKGGSRQVEKNEDDLDEDEDEDLSTADEADRLAERRSSDPFDEALGQAALKMIYGDGDLHEDDDDEDEDSFFGITRQ